MPIYEYRCECGAILESIEPVGSTRERCGDLCRADGPQKGQGRIERLLSVGGIRGDGRETREPTFDPCKRSGRPGGGCDGDDY